MLLQRREGFVPEDLHGGKDRKEGERSIFHGGRILFYSEAEESETIGPCGKLRVVHTTCICLTLSGF